MTGGPSTRKVPHVAALLAAFALFGATGAGQAQQQVELAATAAVDLESMAGPMFVPDEGLPLEEAFAAFDTPIEPALPDHAVDITTIEPAEPEATSLGRGVASYYGRRFHGRPTANGERFDMHEFTAAHRTLPFGSRVRVTNPRNGQSVIVRINDRGPFVGGRTIDLSRAAAEDLGIIRAGHGTVELELLD